MKKKRKKLQCQHLVGAFAKYGLTCLRHTTTPFLKAKFKVLHSKERIETLGSKLDLYEGWRAVEAVRTMTTCPLALGCNSRHTASNGCFRKFIEVKIETREGGRGLKRDERKRGREIGCLRPRTPRNIWDGWSHCTDTSKPVVGYGVQNMITVQFKPATFRSLNALTNCATRFHRWQEEAAASEEEEEEEEEKEAASKELKICCV
jgi:hypothetical protein